MHAITPPSQDQGVHVTKLEEDRAAHLAELDRLRESLQEVPETSIEEGDPTVFERENTLIRIREVEEHLAEINRALDAARRGGYGICEHCGRPIEAERLAILPETRVCVQCKTLLEKPPPHQGW